MKARFDTTLYFTRRGGAALTVETSSQSESEQVAGACRQALALQLASIPGITKVETRYHSLSFEVEPQFGVDLAARAWLIGEIIGLLARNGVRCAPLQLIDWLTAPYRDRHPVRPSDELLRYGPDVTRFDRLQALRLPSITPWLDGREKVRDRASFVAFHGLDASSQALLRQAARGQAIWSPAPCADGCHQDWAAASIATLLADGWLANNNRKLLMRGPRLSLLNQAAGELMGD